jgi:hypothetical protein
MIDLSRLFKASGIINSRVFGQNVGKKTANMEILSYKLGNFCMHLHKKCNGMLFEKYIQTIIKIKRIL